MPPWHIQLVLITGFKSLPGLPGVKGLIAACIRRNPSSSNSHPHRVCNFRTLSSGSDSNADAQYSQLKRFIVRDLTDWVNENHKKKQIVYFQPRHRVIPFWIVHTYTILRFIRPLLIAELVPSPAVSTFDPSVHRYIPLSIWSFNPIQYPWR